MQIAMIKRMNFLSNSQITLSIDRPVKKIIGKIPGRE